MKGKIKVENAPHPRRGDIEARRFASRFNFRHTIYEGWKRRRSMDRLLWRQDESHTWICSTAHMIGEIEYNEPKKKNTKFDEAKNAESVLISPRCVNEIDDRTVR